MIKYNQENENIEQPKMLEVYLDQAWQSAFCYALACEKPKNEFQGSKLLMTIIAGNDSTIQAMKATVDIGSIGGISFGYGEKQLTQYDFHKEFNVYSDKGKYEKFPITINQNRKAVAIVHDDLLGSSNYILSFEGDPAEDLRQLLGGGKYGLHILPEWKNIIFKEFLDRGVLEKLDFYFDKELFSNGLYLYKLKFTDESGEEEADNLISELISKGLLRFPKSGDGSSVENIEDLSQYMSQFMDDMVEKVSTSVKPIHNPLTDSIHPQISTYKRELFPVQAHVSTAVAKVLKKQKVALIQGEMSTGKSTMMTAIPDVVAAMSNKQGYFACLMCPPSLTKKWPEEIKAILPDSEVFVIDKTEEIIAYHRKWTTEGRPKPTKPTFFIISFTTMRGDCATVPAVKYQYKSTEKAQLDDANPYKNGYYCLNCGNAHQVVESVQIRTNEDGIEEEVEVKRTMMKGEFGTTRRIHSSKNPSNAFCSECGDSLWSKKVPTRYENISKWMKYETKLANALQSKNKRLAEQVNLSQPDINKKVGFPRRISTIEYIRRKMRWFFDLSIIDEIHMLKSGLSAQGNSLGSLAAVSKKVVGGTGTLFGGKAEDVYYLLWRLFPHLMVENGYKYTEVRKWNEEYGNIETTIYGSEDLGEYSNKQSRGGTNRRTEKVMPGISPFVFSKFLVQNSVLVRLKDVWPDPVELIDVPTILVDLDKELKPHYIQMVSAFERAIHDHEEGYKLYLPLTQTAIAYPDNPFTYPEFIMKNGTHVWTPDEFLKDHILNKEKKLQEIITGEISEGRKSIVYVRDTGSSVEGRDIRPRLKYVLEKAGAKVCILDTSTTATNKRSEWLKEKIENEDYDVCIVSQELVQVGLDLLCTPTLIFYQFSWSLFTVNQAARRAWRIGQTNECRLFYLAYKDTFQEQMATLIAQKNKAAGAINGDVSSDGLNAMLGDDGDLQTLLIESIKKGTVLKGSTEEWVLEASDRAREILAGIGNTKRMSPDIKDQFINWVSNQIKSDSSKNVLIRKAKAITTYIKQDAIQGFKYKNNVLEVDLIEAFGFDVIADGEIVAYLTECERFEKNRINLIEVKNENAKNNKRRIAPVNGQLAFNLF